MLLMVAAGLSRMPILSFMTATLLGMVVPVVAIVAVGDSLDTSPSRSMLILGGLLLLALIPIAWWRLPRYHATARHSS